MLQVVKLCAVAFMGLQHGIHNKWTKTLVEQSNSTKSTHLDGNLHYLQYLNMTHMQRRMHTFGIKAINNEDHGIYQCRYDDDCEYNGMDYWDENTRAGGPQ